MRRALVLLALTSACAAPIRVAGPERVTRVDRPAKAVRACVVIQERYTRPGWNAVADFGAPPWDYAITSILLRHDDELVVVDPAYGTDLAQDWAKTPFLFREGVLGPLKGKTSLVAVLAELGIEPREVKTALLTHSHWDHTGALPDLPRARVLLPRTELEWNWPMTHHFEGGCMPRHLKLAGKRLAPFTFDGPPVEGFATSHDVFGDGAVVAVPMPGHTPGSAAWLVRLTDGRTAFLIGDTSWTSYGVERPVGKLVPIDADRAQVADQLGVLHAFKTHRPDLLLLPAHDAAALAQLPVCEKGF